MSYLYADMCFSLSCCSEPLLELAVLYFTIYCIFVLDRRRRRWTNVESALSKRFVACYVVMYVYRILCQAQLVWSL